MSSSLVRFSGGQVKTKKNQQQQETLKQRHPSVGWVGHNLPLIILIGHWVFFLVGEEGVSVEEWTVLMHFNLLHFIIIELFPFNLAFFVGLGQVQARWDKLFVFVVDSDVVSLVPGISLNFLLYGVNLHVFELEKVGLNSLLEDLKLLGEFFLDSLFADFLIECPVLVNWFLYDILDLGGSEVGGHGVLEDNEEEILQMVTYPCVDPLVLVPLLGGLVLGLSSHRIL